MRLQGCLALVPPRTPGGWASSATPSDACEFLSSNLRFAAAGRAFAARVRGVLHLATVAFLVAAALLGASRPAVAEEPEKPIVNLHAYASEVVEGEPVRFRVVVSPTANALTVNLRGTISGGYVVGYPSGTETDGWGTALAFPASENSQSQDVGLETTDDDVESRDGRVRLRVNPSEHFDSATGVVTVAVTDNDRSLVTVEVLDEPSGAPTPVYQEGDVMRLKVTRSRSSGETSLRVSIDVSVDGESAVDGFHVLVFSGSEDTTRTVLLPLPRDGTADGERTGRVSISTFPGAELVLPEDLTFRLRDAPGRVSVDLRTHPARVTEGETATVRVVRETASEPLTVNLEISTEGDFGVDDRTTTLNLATGQTEASLALDTLGDDLDEADGSVTVRVAPPDADRIATPRYVTDADAHAATVAIADDDLPVVSVAANDSSVDEGGFGAFTLTRLGDLTVPLEVAVSSRVLPAAATASRTLSFSPGASTSEFEVPVPDDGELQSGRELVVTITASADGTYRIGTGQGEARVAVVDDQAPRLRLDAVRTSVPESHACATFLIRYADVLGEVSAAHDSFEVPVALSYQGALFAANAGTEMTVTLASLSQTFCVPLADDDETESDGSVTATMRAPGDNAIYVLAAGADSATVTVTDDDLPLVSVAPSPSHAGGAVEGDSVELTLTRAGYVADALTVPLTWRIGEAAEQSTTAAFPADSDTATVSIAVPHDDGRFRPPRGLTVTLRQGDGWRVAGPGAAGDRAGSRRRHRPGEHRGAPPGRDREPGVRRLHAVAGECRRSWRRSPGLAGSTPVDCADG